MSDKWIPNWSGFTTFFEEYDPPCRPDIPLSGDFDGDLPYFYKPMGCREIVRRSMEMDEGLKMIKATGARLDHSQMNSKFDDSICRLETYNFTEKEQEELGANFEKIKKSLSIDVGLLEKENAELKKFAAELLREQRGERDGLIEINNPPKPKEWQFDLVLDHMVYVLEEHTDFFSKSREEKEKFLNKAEHYLKEAMLHIFSIKEDTLNPKREKYENMDRSLKIIAEHEDEKISTSAINNASKLITAICGEIRE